MKHYTSIEQSKRLIELGLGFNTADMSYPRELYLGESEYPVVIAYGFKVDWTKALPSWSLAALLELIPSPTLGKVEAKGFNQWYCNTINFIGFGEKNFSYDGGYHDDPISACIEVIIWLLENKYI